MGVDTKLTMEEYKELEKKFILHCSVDSDSTDYSLYVDNKKKLTFGIGFNIEDNPNWLAIALLYKFSGLKPIEEINTIGYQKDVLLYGNGKYNKFIEENCKGISADNKVLQIMRKYKTAKNTKVKNIDKLSKEIQKLIDEYNKRSDIEKIPVNDFSFEFTDEEISLIYDIGKKEYENQLAQHLTGTGKPFNIHSIKDTKLYISLLSFTYQQGGGNLQEHSNIFQGVAKSRFLIWFTLRYNVLSFTMQYKRRLHESTLFGLIENQAVDTKKADIPATILDVFSYLNFFMAGGDNTYLSFIKTNDRCETMDIKAVDDGLVLFNKQPRYDVIKSSLQTEDFIKDFFSDESYFEGKFLKDSFPDDENPKGRTLKGIIDFASHSTIFSIFTRFIEESFVKEIKNKKGSEELFLLENIYVIDCINKNDFKLLLEQKYSGLQERCNVLIFLNSTSDIVNDISYLQAKCPNVYFTIAIQEGYTYSFRLDEKSSTQTNIILYRIKDGKYIPELIKETFKAENISNEENQDEKNILLFSAENSKNLSGRLSNNTNIFHITHKSEDDIISKIKLYNMISDKYEGNIQIDMQGKEYDVSADKSSGYLTLDITLNVLDEVLNDEDINDIPYYMYVNDTGEIFESKISNGKVSFGYCPTASCKNQKVLFAFDKAYFMCKKTANGKCLDFIHINKTYMKNKQVERTFTINKEDVPQYSITGVELDNIEEIASSNLDVLLNIEYRFKAYSDIEDKSKIKWGYMLLNNSELKSLSNITVLKPSVKLYEKFHQLTETGDMISVVPNKILSKDEIKFIQNKLLNIVLIAYLYNQSVYIKQLGTNNYSILFLEGNYVYFLNKDKRRLEQLMVQKIDKNGLNNQNNTYILKSWYLNNIYIVDRNIAREISYKTIAIINRKDMDKNTIIYKCLDKLFDDYQKYKENFPNNYYNEFGISMIQYALDKYGYDINTSICSINDVILCVEECCKLIGKSLLFGNKIWLDGGIAIYHVYENMVPKYDGDNNGTDKVIHFLFSCLFALKHHPYMAYTVGVLNEKVDEYKYKLNFLQGKDIGTGFDMGDIQANLDGIDYAIYLQNRLNNDKEKTN